MDSFDAVLAKLEGWCIVEKKHIKLAQNEIGQSDVALFLQVKTGARMEECVKLANGTVINGKVDIKTLHSRMPESNYEDSIKAISAFTGQSYENVVLESKRINLPSSSPSASSASILINNTPSPYII